jgi:coenzyme F420-reducing hydrogenase beta subunit
MNSVFINKESCCGCSACHHICLRNAIIMKPDKEGFLYPNINQDLCIDCKMCIKVCPLLKVGKTKEGAFPKVYATKHKSDDVRMTCTSGGAFTGLSDYILTRNGLVYGVDFDENFYVCHKRAKTAYERNRFKISKYVQSDLKNTFTDIKNDLIKEKLVLFTGTPCQAAGLRSFIDNQSYAENLYICDLICYGIPSPLIWQEYLHYLENKYEDKIDSIYFRNKSFGWNRNKCGNHFIFTTKNSGESHINNDYYSLYFFAQTIIRPSCYQCKFTDIKRPSDITIADYWGIEKYVPGFTDNKGISLLLLNSPKGKMLFEHVKNDFEYLERPAKECLAEQPRLHEPVKSPPNRTQFWQDYYSNGFSYLIDNYTNKTNDKCIDLNRIPKTTSK